MSHAPSPAVVQFPPEAGHGRCAVRPGRDCVAPGGRAGSGIRQRLLRGGRVRPGHRPQDPHRPAHRRGQQPGAAGPARDHRPGQLHRGHAAGDHDDQPRPRVDWRAGRLVDRSSRRWLLLPLSLRAATSHTIAVALGFAFITALHIVLGELAPKTVALQHAERTALIVGRPTEIFMRVFWPFITVLNSTGRWVVRLLGLKPPSGSSLVHSEEELKMLVTASQEAGVIEEDEEQMLHRVFGFGDLTAGQVMLPRTEMLALPVRIARDGAARPPLAGDAAGHPGLRRPPRRHRRPRPHARTCSASWRATDEVVDLTPMLHEPLTVPDTLKADDLLTDMRKRRTPLAIVIDEYGGTAGMVTFERLMERIVGEVGTAGDGGDLGHHGPDRRLGAHRRAGPDHRRERAVRPADRRRPLRHRRRVRARAASAGGRGSGMCVEVGGRTIRVEALDGLRVARVLARRRRRTGSRGPHAALLDRQPSRSAAAGGRWR